MNNSLQRDLYETYNRFYETNNIREKIFIRDLVRELINLFPQDKFLMDVYNNFSRTLDRGFYHTQQVINEKNKESYEFIEKNRLFIEKIIPLNKEIDKEPIFNYYHMNTLMQILYDFLLTISKELYDFTLGKVQDGRLLIGNINCHQKDQDYNGFAGLLGGKKLNTYIYVNKLNNLNDLLTLIHEIGHAYFFKINNVDFHFFDNNEQNIKCEIPANLMEILFIRYLTKIGMKKEAIELMKDFNVRIDNEKENKDFINLKYRIGSFVGSQYADSLDTYYLEDIFRFIYQVDFRLLLQKSSKHFDGFSIDYDLDDNFVKIFNSL